MDSEDERDKQMDHRLPTLISGRKVILLSQMRKSGGGESLCE